MSKNQLRKNANSFSRRNFIGTAATAAAAFTIVPRHVLGGTGYTAPSDLVNIAGIGIGSQGGGDIQNIATPDVPIQRRMGFSGMLRQSYAGIQPVREPRPQRSAGVANSNDVVQMGAAGGAESFKHANIYALCDVDQPHFSCCGPSETSVLRNA